MIFFSLSVNMIKHYLLLFLFYFAIYNVNIFSHFSLPHKSRAVAVNCEVTSNINEHFRKTE